MLANFVALCVRVTQIAGLLSSLVVLLVVVAIGFMFEPLPQVSRSLMVQDNRKLPPFIFRAIISLQNETLHVCLLSVCMEL